MKTIFAVSLNIVLYIVYIVLVSLMFSFAFPQILDLLGKPLLDTNDPFFDKIQIVIMIVVLIITAVLRKYFYIPIENDSHELADSIHEYEQNKKKNKKKHVEQSSVASDEKEDIKIYIDKEIK